MFTKKDLFLLVPTLAVVVVPNAFANIPSTAYMEDYVATEIAKAQPVVNDATLTIQKNGTSVGTFTANQSTNKTINITVPTGALASKDAVTTSEIADGTIMNADIATNAAIAASKISGLAKVATSGSYNDLSNKPTLGALASKDAVTTSEITDGTIANADIATNAAIAASKISGLARVATSGSYNDLSNKPSIPSAYTLPVATTTVLGGVKQGDNVTIASDGKVSVATGTPSALGVVKVGQIPSGSATSTTYATIWVE